MRTITGIFASRDTAAHGLRQLRAVDVHDDRINVLAPGASEREIADVPTAEGEGSGNGPRAKAAGTGAALGAVVGGAAVGAGAPPRRHDPDQSPNEDHGIRLVRRRTS
jgi:hypothetical protein